jgi:hypothetical protein
VSDKDDTAGPAEVVDFDALNAALGVASPSASLAMPDSEGRSSATYASARPHAIPATRAPAELPNEPAVIVQVDDTVQTGPPGHMTVQGVGSHPIPGQPGPPVEAAAALPKYNTSEPFVPPAHKRTVVMPERPRRPGTATMVVNATNEPTRQQKFLVFFAMLVIVVSAGLAVLVYLKPNALNFGPHSSPPGSRAAGAATDAAKTRAH